MAMGQLPSADDGEEGGLFAEINITPLTDIFLVLLIIFMVTSSVMADAGSQSALDVELPKAGPGAAAIDQRPLVVSIDTLGRLALEDKQVEADALDSALKAVAELNPARQVVIRADAAITHGHVVGLMQRVRGAGLSRISVAVQAGQ